MSEVNIKDMSEKETLDSLRAREKAKFINEALRAGFTAPQAELLFSMKKDTRLASMGFSSFF